MKSIVLILVSWMLPETFCLAGNQYAIHGTTDKEVAIYEPGETMTFTFRVMDDGRAVAGKTLKWERMGDDGITERGEGVADGNGLTVKTTLKKPGFVRIKVAAYDEDGQPLQGYKGGFGKSQIGDIFFDGGACVDPEKLTPVDEPEDFDAFWEEARNRLDAVPVHAERSELSEQHAKVRIFALTIDCAGPRPVTGYLTVPADAGPGTLPARVTFHGYGVKEHKPPKWGPLDEITLNINAHGMELGKEESYYEELKKELKGYCFNNDNGENDNPETSYYYGMVLRVLRALQYVKSLPEWDGETLVSKGVSQGGLQSLWAAGLDSDVIRCEAIVPWSCNLAGSTLGRMRGWVPEYTEALNYFDPVFHARRIKADVMLKTRFGDYTCPPGSVWVVYNNLSHNKKSITIAQGGTHGFEMRNAISFTVTPEGVKDVGISEKNN